VISGKHYTAMNNVTFERINL